MNFSNFYSTLLFITVLKNTCILLLYTFAIKARLKFEKEFWKFVTATRKQNWSIYLYEWKVWECSRKYMRDESGDKSEYIVDTYYILMIKRKKRSNREIFERLLRDFWSLREWIFNISCVGHFTIRWHVKWTKLA